MGALRAFQMPASQALLPQLVPFDRLPQALALSATALQGAIIGRPALGGALYALAPALLAAMVDPGAASGAVGTTGTVSTMGVSDVAGAAAAGAALVHAVSTLGFALSMAAVLRLRPRPVPGLREPMSVASLAVGLRFSGQRPVVLGAVALDLFAALPGRATAAADLCPRHLAHRALGPGPAARRAGSGRAADVAGTGPAADGAGTGEVAGAAAQRRSCAWLLGALAVFGVTMVAFGLSRNLALSIAILACSGAADMVSVVVRQSLVQLATPDAMRGRVSAVNGVFIGASNPLGEFEYGATAALFGPVASVVAGGIGTVVVALVVVVVAAWVRWFPALARHDRLVRGGDDRE